VVVPYEIVPFANGDDPTLAPVSYGLLDIDEYN
jgi:hypothetical protein